MVIHHDQWLVADAFFGESAESLRMEWRWMTMGPGGFPRTTFLDLTSKPPVTAPTPVPYKI